VITLISKIVKHKIDNDNKPITKLKRKYTMAEFNLGNWTEWDSNKLSKYLEKNDVPGSYAETFITNNIDGTTASSLTESHLKEMGIKTIGDRVKIINALETLKKAKAIENNNREIWTGKQMLFDSNLSWASGTCCGLCPRDPKTYVLTNNHLQIVTVEPTRCLCIALSCLAPTKHTDNIDLSGINDVDFSSEPPGCIGQIFCCERVQEKIEIETNSEGTKTLQLRKEVGEDAAQKIKQQVEVAQRMERS